MSDQSILCRRCGQPTDNPQSFRTANGLAQHPYSAARTYCLPCIDHDDAIWRKSGGKPALIVGRN